LTFLAATALHIETKAPDAVAAYLRRRELGKQIANMIEEPGIGRRITSWCASDRSLVDNNNLVQLLEPLNRPVRARAFLGAIEMAEQSAAQNVVHQCALARAANARYTSQSTKW